MATAMKDIATNLQNFAEVVSLAVLPKWCGYEGAENTNNSNNTSEMKIGKLSQLVEADILNRTYYEQKMTNCCNPRIVAAMATLLHRYTQLDTIGITCEVASKNEKRSNSFKAVTVSFSNEVSFQEICSQVTDQLSKTTADTFDNRLLQSLLKNNFIGNEIIKSLFRFVASNDLSFNNLMHPNEFLLQLGSTDETKIGKTEKLLIYYDSMLYSEDQARQILTNISTILLNGFSNSIQPVQKMCILSEAKRQKILFEFNNINTNSLDDINTTGGLVQVFLQNIPKRPYKLAVVEDHGSHVTSLTYSMLHKRALAAASILHKNRFQLSKKDTPAEALIAVLLPQGINCITACLSCLILDKSVASIHYAFSPNDIKNSLSDIGNPFLITDKKKWESMEISYDDVFLLDNYNEDISIMAKSFTSQMLKTSLKSNTASFCYFTSGSTGTPKPVHMTVKGMLNIVKCVAAHYVNGENTKSMLVAPSGRSLSYLELWGSFYVGATVYIPPEDVRTDMDKLRRWLYYYDITNLSLSASIAETLVSCTPEKQIYLSKLNWILMGGEKCHKMDLRSRHYKFTCTLIYGTSESSPVTEYTMNSGKIHVNPPAGSSIKNASVYVLDKWLNPVPIGVKGDIYTGGIGFMDGYVNKPELTASVFFPNPFIEGSLMFRTEDIGYWSPNGTLNISGRKMAQMNINGFILDLGDVEGVLKEFPGVEQCIVVPRNIGNSKLILGFCKLKQGIEKPSTSEILAFLQNRLHPRAIPQNIYIVTDLPRNASGKILRRSLTQYLKKQNISFEDVTQSLGQ